MVITWFGLSSLKITSGNFSLITDPFAKSTGLTPPRSNKTDVVVVSDIKQPEYNNFKSVMGEETFVIDGPGEFDVKGIFVAGTQAENGKDKNAYAAIYRIDLEGATIGFLGSLKSKKLTETQLETLGDVDILFIPVGGGEVCDASEAVTVTNQLQPKFVIPIHFAQKGLKKKLDKLENFLKEIGAKDTSAQEKLTLKKSDLTQEKTEVVALEPER